MYCTDVFLCGIYIYMYAYTLCIQHMGRGSYHPLGKVILELHDMCVRTVSREEADLFHFLETPRTVSAGVIKLL